MLLTISCCGDQAPDLGFLLHKNPARPQTFDLSYGRAYVFYPEVTDTRCTVALLLDIDPLVLARGKPGEKGGGLFDYVSDRPYVSSSFMSNAIAKVFGTALSGRCEQRPQLAAAALDLAARVTRLPCRADPAWLERVFAPLGYEVELTGGPLDEQYPEWGQSLYVDLSLHGQTRLSDLLSHLYVLIPVFDRQKHYWVGTAEIEKLLRHGAGWLESHPEKKFITDRYFNRQRRLAGLALDRLNNSDGEALEQDDQEEKFPSLNLNALRLEAVLEAVKDSGAKSVIDLGCGEGRFLQLLLRENQFTRVAGMDVSFHRLERAREKLEGLPEVQRNRLNLFQGALTYKDDRLAGYEAATVVEVIEHLDQNRLKAFERVLFGEARPQVVALTTPNREFNANYQGLAAENMRHSDHRFEWNRAEFQAWAARVAEQYAYTVQYQAVGEADEEHGPPTQMGVFKKCA